MPKIEPTHTERLEMRIEPALKVKIEGLSKKLGISGAEVIRMAVNAFKPRNP